jgi:3-methyladenine DNA glycosylase/8-oxoguanine DNA glycosylase
MYVRTPSDYDLARDACSYGYFLLAPNHWHPPTRSLWRVLTLPGSRSILARITQPGGPGTRLRVDLSHRIDRGGRANLEAQVRRMLRLDETALDLARFHRLDRRFARSGRGRLFRSPTLFEDVIKTVTSCNVTWPGTVVMNRRLCEVLGAPTGVDEAGSGLTHAFPAPEAVAAATPELLRARCRVGYRDRRIIELARLFRDAPDRLARLEDPAASDDDIYAALLELPGIGPYAAGNIMQLLGRYSRLPLDTESVRHGRTVLKMRGEPASIMRRMRRHYARFKDQAFRSYWFELWAFYESRHGPAHTWERHATGSLFTAALLTRPAPERPAPASR